MFWQYMQKYSGCMCLVVVAPQTCGCLPTACSLVLACVERLSVYLRRVRSRSDVCFNLLSPVAQRAPAL
jgi:hypothetical protein